MRQYLPAPPAAVLEDINVSFVNTTAVTSEPDIINKGIPGVEVLYKELIESYL